MFHHITVGVAVDEHDQSADAIALGQVLAGFSGAALHVVSSYPPDPIGSRLYTGGESPWSRGEAEAALKRAEDLLGERAFAEFHARPGGSPARTLQQWAEESGTELLVIGSCHRGRVGRTLLGSVADRLLHGAPCAVAIAPRGWSEAGATVTRMGVAWDGAPEANGALAVAEELALAAGATLEIIRVWQRWRPLAPSAGLADLEEFADRDRALARASLNDAVRRASAMGSATGSFRCGAPAGEILAASRSFDALFLGSRGYGPARHALLGGVSEAVVRDAACPVVVLPRAALPAPTSANVEAPPTPRTASA